MSINIHLIRHGQSDYNVDQNIRLNVLDWDIQLTDVGVNQVRSTANKLQNIVDFDDSQVEHNFFVSPFKRTRQTYDILKNTIGCENHNIKYDPLISEQRTPVFYGKYLKSLYDAYMNLHPQNKFWAKYLDFETGFEVYQRACLFKNIIRDVIYMSKNTHEINFYIISHGFFIRTLRMAILNYTIDEFIKLNNPYYAELLTLSISHDIIVDDPFPQYNSLFEIQEYSE